MHGRHKSLDKELKRSIQSLQKIDGIKKIILGFSECCRHRYPPGYIKVRAKVDGGLKANGFSGKGVTDLFIRISPEELIKPIELEIKRRFPKD